MLPSLNEVTEAVARLKCGKAVGVHKISAELLTAGGVIMTQKFHNVKLPLDNLVLFILTGKGSWLPLSGSKRDCKDCNNSCSIASSAKSAKQGSFPSVVYVDLQPATETKET